MPLTGQAKTDYQREYMRRRKAKNPCNYSETRESSFMEAKAGYVYIIHCIGFPYYKIGITTGSPKARIDSLQTGLPFELELEYAAQVNDIVETERLLHSIYKNERMRGEWFMLTNTELDTVKRHIIFWKEYDHNVNYIQYKAEQTEER